MQWIHRCSLEWMKARQDILTASDIKELLPVTPSGRSRTVTRKDFMKVFSKKNILLKEDDCISTGAAARGHILESYAIDEYNLVSFAGHKLYHWDDVVCFNEVNDVKLGFSPDACNFPLSAFKIDNATINTIDASKINIIGEVKSYSAERHFTKLIESKLEMEERWQIATAMAAFQNIDIAKLIFFNPDIKKYGLSIVAYSRKDLETEINIIYEICDMWYEFINDLKFKNSIYSVSDSLSDKIQKEYIESRSLNPW